MRGERSGAVSPARKACGQEEEGQDSGGISRGAAKYVSKPVSAPRIRARPQLRINGGKIAHIHPVRNTQNRTKGSGWQNRRNFIYIIMQIIYKIKHGLTDIFKFLKKAELTLQSAKFKLLHISIIKIHRALNIDTILD